MLVTMFGKPCVRTVVLKTMAASHTVGLVSSQSLAVSRIWNSCRVTQSFRSRIRASGIYDVTDMVGVLLLWQSTVQLRFGIIYKCYNWWLEPMSCELLIRDACCNLPWNLSKARNAGIIECTWLLCILGHYWELEKAFLSQDFYAKLTSFSNDMWLEASVVCVDHDARVNIFFQDNDLCIP